MISEGLRVISREDGISEDEREGFLVFRVCGVKRGCLGYKSEWEFWIGYLGYSIGERGDLGRSVRVIYLGLGLRKETEFFRL